MRHSGQTTVDPDPRVDPQSLRLERDDLLWAEARKDRSPRRRRRIVAACTATVVLAGAAPALVSHSRPSFQPRPLKFLPPGQALARAPYMGVSCLRPNSIACDRVGLAVHLRQPARSVVAVIGVRRFALDDGALFQVAKPRPSVRRAFTGFLRPAGLRGPGPLTVAVENGRNRWTGVRPVRPRVRLLISYPDGSRAATELRIPLAPGWG